jgi:hypothetical protein
MRSVSHPTTKLQCRRVALHWRGAKMPLTLRAAGDRLQALGSLQAPFVGECCVT